MSSFLITPVRRLACLRQSLQSGNIESNLRHISCSAQRNKNAVQAHIDYLRHNRETFTPTKSNHIHWSAPEELYHAAFVEMKIFQRSVDQVSTIEITDPDALVEPFVWPEENSADKIFEAVGVPLYNLKDSKFVRFVRRQSQRQIRQKFKKDESRFWVYTIPAGSKIPEQLKLLQQHGSTYVLNCASPMSKQELQGLSTDFMTQNSTKMLGEDFVKAHGLKEINLVPGPSEHHHPEKRT